MTANYHKPPVPVFIFMGTSGCGKSSVAAACQKILGCEVLEGDELHPKANIDKMSKGIPLVDDDRWPWLNIIRDAFSERAEALYDNPDVDEKSPKRAVMVTCSSLRRSYRELLSKVNATKVSVTFVYLKGSPELLQARMAARHNHFMLAGMLNSQLNTLEEPDQRTENVIVAPIDPPTDAIAKKVVNEAKERHILYIE
ncbi:hypothetical protein K450DRAFT_230436 [Umbelopsis ramanniana AG]|uniref:Gluconokinase n=1 Tax=Umbelopsis ramanniana AG TaxID=1314678 RepID=A0AAD5EDR3_UMBRA|nr:uncharacterized protein K450DRAFT_230436 [Umbelopsis ramanniana AG]KAI8582021.1 hypothetical protein K450DRAFT_230436 [Umbelopsis ramanniana AG]